MTMDLAGSVGRGLDCRVLFQRPHSSDTKTRSKVIFVGTEVDAAVAKYLYVRLEYDLYWAATHSAREVGVKGGRIGPYRKSFIMGASEIIQNRLTQQKAEEAAKNAKYGALIVRKSEAINDYVDVEFGQVGRTNLNYEVGVGYRQGQAAGQSADISMGGLDGRKGSQPRLT